ncbi:hypothetical protein DET61_104275 [Marinobacter nauticus]|uniref:Polysaccharide biosynthesis protein n=1 Tax=Marinobacter nauticus TaxID=2743 RepID=A0A368XX50_MARNT|nr:hypothetical protein [Marinobacter nauticus]RCW71117.1 hypothetical protein DET61_104275 [Marinobacter nauticus]
MIISIKISNLISLYGIQFLNGIVPILLFPYILGVYGAKEYESFVTSEIFSLVFFVIVSFGFEITSIKKIKKYNYISTKKLALIYFKTIYSRVFIWCGLFLLAIFSLTLLNFQKNFILMAVGWMLFPLGFIFYSNYFHLARNTNLELFCALLMGRGSGALLATQFEYNSVVFVPYAISVPFVCIGVLFFILTIRSNRFVFLPIKIASIGRFLLSSFEVFKNSLALITLKEFNVVIVSWASTDPSVTALYSILDKLLRAVSALMRPLFQFFLPNALSIMQDGAFWLADPRMWVIIFKQFFLITILLIFVLLLPVESIYAILVGLEIPEVSRYLAIMIVSVYFGVLNFYFLIFSSVKSNPKFPFLVLLSGFLGMTSMYFLTKSFNESGFSLAFVVPELVLATLLLLQSRAFMKIKINGC